jgi:hypothetical protein
MKRVYELWTADLTPEPLVLNDSVDLFLWVMNGRRYSRAPSAYWLSQIIFMSYEQPTLLPSP